MSKSFYRSPDRLERQDHYLTSTNYDHKSLYNSASRFAKNELPATDGYSPKYNNGQISQIADRKFQDSKSSFEYEEDSLKREISRVRTKIDLSHAEHARNLDEIKVNYENQLRNIKNQKEFEIKSIEKKIEMRQRDLEEKRDNISTEQNILSKQLADKERQISKLQIEVGQSGDELKNFRGNLEFLRDNEINRKKYENVRNIEYQEREFQMINSDQELEYRDIQARIQTKDGLIESLQNQLRQLRRDQLMNNRDNETEIATENDKLYNAKKDIEVNDIEINKIVATRDAARNEISILSRDTTQMENSLEGLIKKHRLLKEKSEKLSSLVYGRKVKSPGKSPAKSPTKSKNR